MEAPYTQRKITLKMCVHGGILHPCPGCSPETSVIFTAYGSGRSLSAGSVLGCLGFLQDCSKKCREESGSEDLTELWLLPTLQVWLMVLWGHERLPARKQKQRRYFRKTYNKRKNFHYSNALLQKVRVFPTVLLLKVFTVSAGPNSMGFHATKPPSQIQF